MIRASLLPSIIAIAAVTCGLAAPPRMLAQEPADARARGFIELGLDPAAVMTLPLGTLESIKGSVPCSRLLVAATSINFGMGLHAAYVLDNNPEASGLRFRAIQLAIGYDDMSSLFASSPDDSYESYDPINGADRVIETHHTAAFTLGYARVAAEAELAIGNHFMLRLGPSLGIPVSGSVRESEAIVTPDNAAFPDRTQERTMAEGTGDLSGLGMRFGIGGALAFRLPLGRKLFVEPNIGADLGLTKVQPAWSPLLVRGGISIGYMLLPSNETAPPPVVAAIPETPRDTAIVEVKENPFAAQPQIDVTASVLPIEFRRQIVARYVPVLPAIFFDQNSSTLPERYVRIDNAPNSFDELTLPTSAELAHYQTLNVFGHRLQAYPRARVTITGTTSRDEDARTGLAAARARQVADYLINNWRIDPGRITLRSKLDPAVPSSSESPQGREENRRVELEFSDDAIYRPIQLRSVEPITEPESIPFAISATSPGEIERWEADITAGEAPLKTIAGTGQPSGEITWSLTNDDRERILSSGGATYRLSVFGRDGHSAASQPKQLPVRLDTTISVRSSAERPDNTAEFLLVTFDFDRADLTRRGRLELQAILDRIGPASTVSIIGYTDPVGEIEHNRSLALGRARTIALLMPKGTTVDYRGASPYEAPYSSTSPEGRFLSRTVRVVVTKPTMK